MGSGILLTAWMNGICFEGGGTGHRSSYVLNCGMDSTGTYSYPCMFFLFSLF